MASGGAMDISEIILKAKEYLPPDKLAVVGDAYDFALKAHEGQTRRSGEPFIEHPLQVALTLVALQMDASTLAAALLHDVPENCGIPVAEIETRFGADIANRLGCGDESEWGGDDLIAFLDTGSYQCEVQGIGSGGDTDSVVNGEVFCALLFEGTYIGAKDKLVVDL